MLNLDDIRKIARVYSRFTIDTAAYKHVSYKFNEEPVSPYVQSLGAIIQRAKNDILKLAEELVEGTLVYEWCKNVKGLGLVAALTYLGYIDPRRPIRCNYKYWGLAPGCKKVSGEKSNFNPWLKGRAYFFARCVVMAKDPYYYQLYKAKKEIYSERPDLKTATNAKIDGKAKFWLAKLLLSHAHALMREELGLPLGEHHPHIPPKPLETNEEEIEKVVGELIEKLKKEASRLE